MFCWDVKSYHFILISQIDWKVIYRALEISEKFSRNRHTSLNSHCIFCWRVLENLRYHTRIFERFMCSHSQHCKINSFYCTVCFDLPLLPWLKDVYIFRQRRLYTLEVIDDTFTTCVLPRFVPPSTSSYPYIQDLTCIDWDGWTIYLHWNHVKITDLVIKPIIILNYDDNFISSIVSLFILIISNT